jgi:hypothetical protein
MEVAVEGLTTMLVIGLLSDVVKGGSASYIFLWDKNCDAIFFYLYIPKGVLKEEWWQAMDALRAGQLHYKDQNYSRGKSLPM